MNVDGRLVLEGGQTSGPAGSLASARIDAGGNITITVNGNGPAVPYTYVDPQTGLPVPLGSFYMIGGSGSGFFATAGGQTQDLTNGGTIPFPTGGLITVSPGAGGFVRVVDLARGESAVQSGLSTFNNSLLSYIIFAANEETRAARLRKGLGEGDDLGAPACK